MHVPSKSSNRLKFDEKAFRAWLKDGYWPLMGREGDDDDADADAGAAGGAGDADVDAGAAGAGAGGTGDADADADADNDHDDDNEPPDELARITEERDKARQELAAAQAAVQREKAAAREARAQAAKKGGNWEQVAKERESELADANERAQTAETARITAVEELDAFRREVRVSRIASRLSFRDPADAIALLKPEETGDDKTAERALRALAKDKDYLVDQRRAHGRAISNGNGDGGTLTLKQIEQIKDPKEITARWDEIQKGLKAAIPG